ncbi:MAG TPA: phosphoribosylglycinamide formyltransferase [Alphaproteobacteria bacterium]
MSGPLRLAIVISGRGSNMRALVDACRAEAFPAEVGVVISNRADAAGLAAARAAGVPVRVLDEATFEHREAFDAALDEAVADAGASLVCLAGFMRLLGTPFVERWRDRLINVHPSLLPAFRGLDTHARVLAAGARFSGCTVHFVRPAMDEGPIIVQAAVAVHTGDSPASLARRVLAQEHRIYPLAVRWIADGRVRVVDERVEIDGALSPDMALVNPGPAR